MIDISVQGELIKITDDINGNNRERYTKPDAVQFIVIGDRITLKVKTDAERFEYTTDLTEITISAVAVIDSADFETKIGVLINFE